MSQSAPPSGTRFARLSPRTRQRIRRVSSTPSPGGCAHVSALSCPPASAPGGTRGQGYAITASQEDLPPLPRPRHPDRGPAAGLPGQPPAALRCPLPPPPPSCRCRRLRPLQRRLTSSATLLRAFGVAIVNFAASPHAPGALIGGRRCAHSSQTPHERSHCRRVPSASELRAVTVHAEEGHAPRQRFAPVASLPQAVFGRGRPHLNGRYAPSTRGGRPRQGCFPPQFPPLGTPPS